MPPPPPRNHAYVSQDRQLRLQRRRGGPAAGRRVVSDARVRDSRQAPRARYPSAGVARAQAELSVGPPAAASARLKGGDEQPEGPRGIRFEVSRRGLRAGVRGRRAHAPRPRSCTRFARACSS